MHGIQNGPDFGGPWKPGYISLLQTKSNGTPFKNLKGGGGRNYYLLSKYFMLAF